VVKYFLLQLHDDQSTMQQSVQIHLETVEMIRPQHLKMLPQLYMIKTFSSKNPPAEYTICSDVLVRRFSSKCRKREVQEKSLEL
jgi:hypothetical protein